MDPTQAKTLDDLFTMERESLNIPYSTKLSPEQIAISDEMSNYGSTLTTSLAACGVLGCLSCIGAACYNMGKHSERKKQPGNSKSNPIVINDEFDWVKKEEIEPTVQDYL